jgi:hypothetical protein
MRLTPRSRLTKLVLISWLTKMILMLLAGAVLLQGCAVLAGTAAGAAAGGAVGYGLAHNGYEVQSPITREDHVDP